MASPKAGRRGFFRLFAGESVAWFEELTGKPQHKLADLWELAEREFSGLIPRVCPGVEIVSGDGDVYALLPGKADLVHLFASSEMDLFIFNRFNGFNTIVRVAGEVSASMGLSSEESYMRVRELFLRLVRSRAFMPSNTVSADTSLPPEIKAVKQCTDAEGL